jgi:hypothetical protein
MGFLMHLSKVLPLMYVIQTPTLDGSIVSCTGAADHGFDFMLSNTLRENLGKEAKHNCSEFNENCIQAVQRVIQDNGILGT